MFWFLEIFPYNKHMDEIKYRRALHKCQSCYDKKYLVGQAFREYTCEYCQQEKMHPNTGVPRICPECAQKENKCSYCLKEQD